METGFVEPGLYVDAIWEVERRKDGKLLSFVCYDWSGKLEVNYFAMWCEEFKRYIEVIHSEMSDQSIKEYDQIINEIEEYHLADDADQGENEACDRAKDYALQDLFEALRPL